MKFNSIHYTVPGRRHLSMRKGNEDFVNVYESDTVLVYAVADGCSESTCAAPASEATVAAGIEFAMNGEIWDMKQKEIRDEYLRILDKHYLACPYPYEDLAATTVLLAINKISNKYLAISIGDCSCIILNCVLEPSLLLQPMNLLRQKDRTVFANSSLASRSMRMEMGSMDGVGGFALITDGADALIDQDCIPDLQQLTSLTVLSPKKAQGELQTYVGKLSETTSDDITVAITMRCDDPEIIKIAGATYDLELMLEEEQDEVPQAEDSILQLDDTDNNESLLEFLRIPRTAEELVIAGYVNAETSLLTVLTPYLKDNLIKYEDHHFSAV